MNFMRFQTILVFVLFMMAAVASAQNTAEREDISGMYSFIKDGEFVQITVEPPDTTSTPASGGHLQLSGFVSRYDDQDGEKGAFVDHFFASGSLDGDQIKFTTKKVHGVVFEFAGKVEIALGKKRAEEGYFLLHGTLKRDTEDSGKKVSSQSREIALKSFPQDF